MLGLVEVAQALGVHYMTAYRYVRLGQLPANKVGSVWQVDRCDLDGFLERGRMETSPRRRADWASRMEARLLGGDQAGAWSIVEAALTGGIEPVEVYTEALGPALRSIGDRWAAGEIDPGQEHLATAIAHRLIGRLGPRFARRGRTRGSVVLAMPPNDRHGLGIAMAGDVLLGAGFEPIDLGADVPLGSLASAIGRVRSAQGGRHRRGDVQQPQAASYGRSNGTPRRRAGHSSHRRRAGDQPGRSHRHGSGRMGRNRR